MEHRDERLIDLIRRVRGGERRQSPDDVSRVREQVIAIVRQPAKDGDQ